MVSIDAATLGLINIILYINRFLNFFLFLVTFSVNNFSFRPLYFMLFWSSVIADTWSWCFAQLIMFFVFFNPHVKRSFGFSCVQFTTFTRNMVNTIFACVVIVWFNFSQEASQCSIRFKSCFFVKCWSNTSYFLRDTLDVLSKIVVVLKPFYLFCC